MRGQHGDVRGQRRAGASTGDRHPATLALGHKVVHRLRGATARRGPRCSRARPHSGPRWCRTSGRRSARVHPAHARIPRHWRGDSREIPRIRPFLKYRIDLPGSAACPATARRHSSVQRSTWPSVRTADRVTARPPRTAESRCIRLCCSVTGDTEVASAAHAADRRGSPTRPPAAATPGVPHVAPYATALSTWRTGTRIGSVP